MQNSTPRPRFPLSKRWFSGLVAGSAAGAAVLGHNLFRQSQAQTNEATPLVPQTRGIPLSGELLDAEITILSAAPLPDQKLGEVIVDEHEATLRSYQTRPQGLGAPVLGAPRRIRLSAARKGQDNVITVRVQRAGQLNVQLRMAGETVTEQSEGAFVTFFLRNRAQGQDVMPATELYRRNLNYARKAAVPGAKTPQRYIVSDLIEGPGPSREALDDSLATARLLGINNLQIRGFGRLSEQIPQLAAQQGIRGYSWAAFAPPTLGDWALPGQSPEQWATRLSQEMVAGGAPPEKVTLFKVAEEPTLFHPKALDDLRRNPEALQKFRNFLQQEGLTPAELGAGSWDEVLPVRRTAATGAPQRKLHYYTLKFLGESIGRGFKMYTDALRSQVNGSFVPYANLLPYASRSYKTGANTISSEGGLVRTGDNDPDAAVQYPYWMDLGRHAAPFGLWTEDWEPDHDSQTWSYHADILRSAARQRPGNIFGANMMARLVGDFGDASGMYRAMAVTGHGGKAILWYNYGPEPFFSPYSYSDNPKAYGAIAASNALLANAEHIMFPGQRGNADIALLLPRSAFYWGPAEEWPSYAKDLKGIYYALSHAHHEVDFVDETGIEEGELTKRGFKVLYVTSPNLTDKSARALKNWVNQGGTVVFSGPQAGGSNEFDSLSEVLTEVRGVRPAGRGFNPDGLSGPDRKRRVVSGDRKWLPATSLEEIRFGAPLPLAGGRTVASYGNGGPAVVSKAFGRGQSLSYGFRPGSMYWDSPQRQASVFPQNWSALWRETIIAPAEAAGAGQRAWTNVAVVEAARLDSNAGTAVTVLNWTGRPVSQLAVTVKDAGTVRNVRLAGGGRVTFIRQGADLRATFALQHVDVLLLER